MVSAHDVSALIIERQHESGRQVDQMKLQKLLYYCQAWSLAWTGHGLFAEDEPVEAWRYGPMVDSIYQEYKDLGDEPIDAARSGSPSMLSPDQRALVEAVLNRYGVLDGTTLAAMTHEDPAWIEAWGDRGEYDRGRDVMRPESIARSARRGTFGHPNQRSAVKDTALLERAAAGDGDAVASILSSV